MSEIFWSEGASAPARILTAEASSAGAWMTSSGVRSSSRALLRDLRGVTAERGGSEAGLAEASRRRAGSGSGCGAAPTEAVSE